MEHLDRLDRAMDEVLGDVMGGSTPDLRRSVLARLAEHERHARPAARASAWRSAAVAGASAALAALVVSSIWWSGPRVSSPAGPAAPAEKRAAAGTSTAAAREAATRTPGATAIGTAPIAALSSEPSVLFAEADLKVRPTYPRAARRPPASGSSTAPKMREVLGIAALVAPSPLEIAPIDPGAGNVDDVINVRGIEIGELEVDGSRD